uniref:Uncharacterized protein n=1 Tax=Arundo donax TaxID=35708 RepID=A0A0A9EWR5_ARUDO
MIIKVNITMFLIRLYHLINCNVIFKQLSAHPFSHVLLHLHCATKGSTGDHVPKARSSSREKRKEKNKPLISTEQHTHRNCKK